MTDPFVSVLGHARGSTALSDTDIIWERGPALRLTKDELWEKQEEMFEEVRAGRPMRALTALEDGVRLFRAGPDDLNECVNMLVQAFTTPTVDSYSSYASDVNSLVTASLDLRKPIIDDKETQNKLFTVDTKAALGALWAGSFTTYHQDRTVLEDVLVSEISSSLYNLQYFFLKDIRWHKGQELPLCTWEQIVRRLLNGGKMRYGSFVYRGTWGVEQFKTLIITDIENALKDQLIAK